MNALIWLAVSIGLTTLVSSFSKNPPGAEAAAGLTTARDIKAIAAKASSLANLGRDAGFIFMIQTSVIRAESPMEGAYRSRADHENLPTRHFRFSGLEVAASAIIRA